MVAAYGTAISSFGNCSCVLNSSSGIGVDDRYSVVDVSQTETYTWHHIITLYVHSLLLMMSLKSLSCGYVVVRDLEHISLIASRTPLV